MFIVNSMDSRGLLDAKSLPLHTDYAQNCTEMAHSNRAKSSTIAKESAVHGTQNPSARFQKLNPGFNDSTQSHRALAKVRISICVANSKGSRRMALRWSWPVDRPCQNRPTKSANGNGPWAKQRKAKQRQTTRGMPEARHPPRTACHQISSGESIDQSTLTK